MRKKFFLSFAQILCIFMCISKNTWAQNKNSFELAGQRERISLNKDWRFMRFETAETLDTFIYDIRPAATENLDKRAADEMPTEAIKVISPARALKAYILPSGNSFIKDTAKWYKRPQGNPGGDFPFVKAEFNDNSWEQLNLPHDWAIKGPFLEGDNPIIGGGMGRLPIHGTGWYRKKINIPASDAGKQIYLDIDGAMSYTMVWLNGNLVGGWPYGYSSFRLDLTPYIKAGQDNQLAIRLDNPPASARWYPGAGLYRNVWLTKTNKIHVAQWGTFIVSRNVTKASANVDIELTIDNNTASKADVEVVHTIYFEGKKITQIREKSISITGNKSKILKSALTLDNPKLWGPYPSQTPNLYTAVTELYQENKLIDSYETNFGVRSLEFNPNKGILVNGEKINLRGANQHHDLGALGGAFNTRAAERQLEILREMGCNSIRLSHNPPAPELLQLTDKMGFLVIDEIFDSWERKKTPLDFHLIFPEWSKQDLRSMVRRDRNSPSIILWSFGNEVGEQYTDVAGAEVAKRLLTILKEEDTSRPGTSAMNFAKPNMPLPAVMDVIGLNYQGEGIRNAPAYAGLIGINTAPMFPAFHEKFPDKVIYSAENASALSSRGEFFYPVTKEISSPLRDSLADPKRQHVSAYELYTSDFGSSADKVFASLDKNPFVAGGFVWTGWDYLGEPTPYYTARSSYSGVIDLAGFKKERFFLYQSYWLPEMPLAHILPHWNWPERTGLITPVHVFTSGDEAELFLNGKSLGRKKKAQYEYRLRWDDVKYQAGELKVIAYKNGKKWATDVVKTTGKAAQLKASADRTKIKNDGYDLAFITVQICDNEGLTVPRSHNKIVFSIEGPGEIVATDNGDPTSFEPFIAHERKAFNGLCLVIVRFKANQTGTLKVKASSGNLKGCEVELKINN